MSLVFKPCTCDTCKADSNAPQRETVGYEGYHYCTANPDFVSVAEWFEHLSGEECKQLTCAVNDGLVKRGQLHYYWDRELAWENLTPEARKDGYDAFLQSYQKWEGVANGA